MVCGGEGDVRIRGLYARYERVDDLSPKSRVPIECRSSERLMKSMKHICYIWNFRVLASI